MSINLSEASAKIRQAGARNVRSVPVPGEKVDGLYQIEILEGASWTTVLSGVPKKIAEDLIATACNRVILG